MQMFLQIKPSLTDDSDCGKTSNVIGKGGARYKKHGAFCLETQKYADAVHHVSSNTKSSNPLRGILFFFNTSLFFFPLIG
jgi:hypothetical protein